MWEALLDWGRTNPIWAATVIGIAGFVDSLVFVGIFVHGTTLFAVCVVFYSQDIVSIGTVFIASLVGEFLGDQASYWVGRGLNDAPFRVWPLKRKKHLYSRAVELVDRRGLTAVALGRIVFPLRSVMPFVCGSLGLAWRRFFIYDAAACAAWVGFWTLILWLTVAGFVAWTSGGAQ